MVEQGIFTATCSNHPYDDLLDNFNWNLKKRQDESRKHSRKQNTKSRETKEIQEESSEDELPRQG